MDAYRLILGDSLEELRKLEENSVDSMVTDPPAGISFMSKKFDTFDGRNHFMAEMFKIFTECLRVLKPGAHGFVWAIPRTSHWTATSLEDAGFEIRDVVTHVFGSGFPKGLSIDKAIDKMNGDQRPVIGKHPAPRSNINATHSLGGSFQESPDITSAASAASAAWQGWGTALKPASEHWILVRKPLEKGLSIAANVLKWRTGALNIDASRIGTALVGPKRRTESESGHTNMLGVNAVKDFEGKQTQGRFPANLVLSHQNIEIFKLKHDILDQVRDVIEVYYDNYEKVSELQKCIRDDISSNGVSCETRTETDRGCSSYKRSEIRQPNRESISGRSKTSFDIASGCREEIPPPFERKPTLEVFAEDIPKEWLKYFEYSRSHGCVEVGTKDVGSGSGYNFEESNNDNPTHITKNIKSGVHYGTETVSSWECTENCPVAMLDAQSGNRPSSGTYMDTKKYSEYEGRGMFAGGKKGNEYANENGGASRFFKTFENDSRFLYCAKASKRERNDGCDGLPEKYNDFQRESSGLSQGKKPATGERSATRLSPKANHHPTVKPIALCKYLINMITPPNGTCIDPFLGSGSTGVAAIRSGFKFIGIEREKEYMDISEARLKHAAKNRT